MGLLSRYTQKLFGSSASAGRLSQFGSLAAGSPTAYSGTTVTPANVQALANFLTGLDGASVGAGSTPIQDLNSLQYLWSYQIAYLLQQGIAEYDAATTYNSNSLVMYGTTLYQSLAANNTGNTPSSSLLWWRAASNTPAGLISPYAGTSAPAGWLMCDGSAVSRTSYATLFGVIGITHGQGDGSTTFNVPDYRGRFLRGVDGGAGRDPDTSSRTAMNTGGNTGDNVGTVQTEQVQSHNHPITDPTHSHGGPGGNNLAYTPSSGPQFFGATSGNPYMAGTSATGTASTGITVNNAGGNETRPINAYVNYLIKY